MDLITLAQNNGTGSTSTASPIAILAMLAFWLALMVVVIAGMWKMFEKAGQPGWAAIIPFYNTYILCKIVGRPGWWLILLMIPYVNFVFWIIVMLDLAKSFARGVGFALGLIFLSPIFFCILGFGSSQYQGPARG